MPFATLTTGQLETNAHARGWIWDGYLAPGQITLFTSVYGLIRRDGTGHRHDAFCYYLPEKMAKWKDDPIHQLNEIYRQNTKQLANLGLDIVGR